MNESQEMYLETIRLLSDENPNVRSVDIARQLQYSKPSVSKAIHQLERKGYLVINENAYIRLTEAGKFEADRIWERHSVLTALLVKTAGVTEAIAEEDACRIEHVISDEVFQGIKEYLK